MKKLIILTGLALATTVAMAQSADSYIVKTKGEKRTEAKVVKKKTNGEEEPTGTDFVSQNFRYYSLCDWKDGMKFMVLPEKYDLVVNTFRDAGTGKEIPSGKLRRKIMIYNNHSVGQNGRSRMNFTCQDDNKKYYFELPNGDFEDYCYGKTGVPTLAYLGDVDIAREKLMNQTLVTRTTDYRVDVDYDSDSYNDVKVEKNMEVKVVAVGVGTRSFPVKIIVADKKGNEFYQNVAISKTNSGMRDEEFDISNMKFHTFRGAFELPADNMAASSAYKKFIGREVYTKYASVFTDQNGKPTKAARLSTFKIMGVRVQRGTHYVMMTLRGLGSGKTYTKEVTFVSQDVSGDIAGTHEDLYDNLFAEGNPLNIPGVQKEHMVDIQKGLVRAGFTEAEVLLALGEPSGRGEIDGKTYTMVYKHIGQRYACVFLDKKTHKVKSVKH